MKVVPFLEKKKSSTPEVFSDYVREGGDFYYWEPGGFWVVTTAELAKRVLTSPEFSADRSKFFISRMPEMDLSLIKDFFGIVRRMMVMSDGKEHRNRRRVAHSAFSDRFINSYKDIVDEVVSGLLDQSVIQGRVDFAEDIAKNLPSIVLADLFNIPKEDRKNFFKWSNNMTAFFGGASQYRNEDGIEVNQSAKNLYAYFSGLVKTRKDQPADDFLSLMLTYQETSGLTDDEIISQVIMMLVAGQVTTTDQLCNNMFTLLSNPDQIRKIREDMDTLEDALEECNRLDPAVTFLFRVTNQETVINGVKVASGQTIFIANHAVNRDPALYENPSEFQISRESRTHFAYGFGPHYCLGAKLARIQMKSLFSEMLRRYKTVRLDDQQSAERWHYSLAFSGFLSLPLKVER